MSNFTRLYGSLRLTFYLIHISHLLIAPSEANFKMIRTVLQELKSFLLNDGHDAMMQLMKEKNSVLHTLNRNTV